MSVPDAESKVAARAAQVVEQRLDVIELAALRGRAREVETLAAARGLALPGMGRAVTTERWSTLSVRPDRWLLLQARAVPGERVAQWQTACAGTATAVDLSSAFTVLHLSGPKSRELLARSCRVDLHESVLPSGRAIATVMAQVAVIIATMPSGLLLLTPSTTARHFREWLTASARLFGLLPHSTGAAVELFGSTGT